MLTDMLMGSSENVSVERTWWCLDCFVLMKWKRDEVIFSFPVLFWSLHPSQTSFEKLGNPATRISQARCLNKLPLKIGWRLAAKSCSHLLVVDVLPVDCAKETVSHDLLSVIRSAAQPVKKEKRRRSQTSNAALTKSPSMEPEYPPATDPKITLRGERVCSLKLQ